MLTFSDNLMHRMLFDVRLLVYQMLLWLSFQKCRLPSLFSYRCCSRRFSVT
jgi:hypothetical protein